MSLYVTNRDEWRAWLKENYDTESEVWLLFYKKHTGVSSIPYDDAVEEALCYGWIDSIVKRIDDKTYIRKFTPRKKKSKWSELNIKRAKKMIEAGKMTEAGLAKFDETAVEKKVQVMPPEIEKALQSNETVWKNFMELAPGYKRQYIGWIMDAKREKTRKKRLKEVIAVLENNEKLGMK